MTPTHLIGSTFCMPIPEDARGFDINKYRNGSELNYWLILGGKDTLIVIDLPPGNWEIICTTKEVTEEQAHRIVESVTTANELPVYRDYEFSTWMKTAVDSLRSLLTSKGLDPEKNYVLIKE